MPSSKHRSVSPDRDRYKSNRDRKHDRGKYEERESRDTDRHRGKGSRDRSRDRDRPKERERDKDRHRRDDRRRSDAHENEVRGRDTKREKNRRDREETESDEELLDLRELGVDEISEDDYFLKSAEFKLWLKDERGRYLDEMSSESAHKYFRKFVRRWNDGALKEVYYRSLPSTAIPSSSNTAYKWSFASNRAKVDAEALAAARADVDRLTHINNLSSIPQLKQIPNTDCDGDDDDDGEFGPSLPGPSGPRLGPALPSASDRQLAMEEEREQAKKDRKSKLKDQYQKADETVPRNVGKEGKMDEKRATNAVNKEMRDKDVVGLEVDEGTLMGDGGGFAAALRARDAAQGRRAEKKALEMVDRRAADEERLSERRQKEAATMDMFKAMARQRFG